MRCPSLRDLPAPPEDKQGWPWNVESPQLPDRMPDGAPWPRISIVSATLNQARYIELMLRSVLLQGYPDVELIVHDGGSTDGTLDILKRYDAWITYWVSEADRGQSHALNKGLARASGRLVNTFDSDDYVTAGAFGVVGGFHAQRPDCMIAGDVLRTWEGTVENEIYFPDDVDLETYVQWWRTYHHGGPGIYYPLAHLEKAGAIDESLHYLWDYELTLRCLEQVPLVALRTPLAVIVHSAGSKGMSGSHHFEWDLAEIWKRRRLEFPRLTDEGDRHTAAMLFGSGLKRVLGGHGDGVPFVASGVRMHTRGALAFVASWPLRKWRRWRARTAPLRA